MTEPTRKDRIDRFRYFFPFQLVFIHLKRNHFLLIFWLILFVITLEKFAVKFGIPQLFLAPEYQGEVGIWSFGILGFSLGGFIMAFDIYGYVINAKRFPFLATTSRPFLKYCINNFIIPASFIITYIVCSVRFLSTTELLSNWQIITYMSAFLAGNLIFILIAVLYFFPTNKNIFKIAGKTSEQLDEIIHKKRSGLRKNSKNFYKKSKVRKWKVSTYMAHPFKISLARDSRHYDKEMLDQVFFQNHVNASLFELIIIIAFVVVGAFQFNPFFEIPAAASTCLVFTVVLMIISVVMSWLKGWTLSVLLALIFLINMLSANWDVINMPNYGYGLNYEEPPVPYNISSIRNLNQDEAQITLDKAYHIEILDRWLMEKRLNAGNMALKPKLILVNVSGGGLRSSLWTLRTLQVCDSLTNGQLMKDTKLIAGSSGGLIGAAYFRELQIPENNPEDMYSPEHLDNISSDILNRILFSFATNDIFVRFRTHEVAGKSYVVDRGMTFEDQLNINTKGILNKSISADADNVYAGRIPTLVISPTILNDGRRLLISSQPISYLGHTPELDDTQSSSAYENIEFRRFFAKHHADSLLLSSALRMSSTFPYILPYASLPTDPVTHVIDAGLRDNFGLKLSAQYISSFEDWIEENTSGVIILQIRDSDKHVEPKSDNSTLMNKITNPIGSFYGNFFKDQDYNMDQIVSLVQSNTSVPVDLVSFELKFKAIDRIAMSWHLTALEKHKVINSIDSPWNQDAIERLQTLMNEQ